MRQWKCTVCGNTQEGDEPSKRCSMCGTPDSFSEVGRTQYAQENQDGDSDSTLKDGNAGGSSCSSGNWKNMSAGHGQSLVAIVTLRNEADSFRKKLISARKEWEEAKANSQKTYDSVISMARKQCEDLCNGYINDRDNGIRATQARRDTVATVVNACENFTKSFDLNVRIATDDEIKNVNKKRDEVVNALNSKEQAYRELCDSLIAEAQGVRNEKLDQARSRFTSGA